MIITFGTIRGIKVHAPRKAEKRWWVNIDIVGSYCSDLRILAWFTEEPKNTAFSCGDVSRIINYKNDIALDDNSYVAVERVGKFNCEDKEVVSLDFQLGANTKLCCFCDDLEAFGLKVGQILVG
jgi:hypothetical protein